MSRICKLKDFSKNDDEKYLFLMAGLFLQTLTLTPFDHAIYDFN